MSLFEETNWFDFIKNNPDKEWCYGYLSMNKMKKDSFFNNQQLSYVLK